MSVPFQDAKQMIPQILKVPAVELSVTVFYFAQENPGSHIPPTLF